MPRKILHSAFFACLIFCLLFSQVFADSLWKKDSVSAYSSSRTYKVGDIITVLILESSSALTQAGTNTDTKDDLSLRFTNTVQSLNNSNPRSELGLNGENKYKGIGSTTRASNIQAKVAAVVTRVFDNGNLAIMGRHAVEVNRDKQEITITGVVRPKDISQNNTVYSYSVAEARVSVKGEGAVAEAESPGWITRIINWLF